MNAQARLVHLASLLQYLHRRRKEGTLQSNRTTPPSLETVEFPVTNLASSTPVSSCECAVHPVGGLIAAYMTFAGSLCERGDVFLVGLILPVTAALIAHRCYFPFGNQKVS